MKLNSLYDLYVDQLRDLYDAENRIIQALPKMAKKASSTDLRDALNEHLDVTRTQKERLEQIFKDLDTKRSGEECLGMRGIIEEGEKLMQQEGEPPVKDAGIIACAQKVEHYEIAGYGCARTYAERLGREEDARKLQQTLEEESTTDEKLTQLAESHINEEAVLEA
ncbi:MAG: ferritin-like domain-containing protein [Acidobacteriota bacterium]